MRNLAALSGLLAALLLGGCQTTQQGSDVRQGATVTRFHLNQPIARGDIRVEPADPAETGTLQFSQYAAAVERELGRLGWRVTPADARSEQVASIRLDQGSREAPRRGSGVSIGIGGGTGGRRSGVGVGVGASLPVGGSRSREIVVTELAVRIQRRSDASAIWEGRAEIEARADSPLASPAAAADRLAEALFRDFPGESGRTITVR